jgi:multiple sugar transport system permease protein
MTYKNQKRWLIFGFLLLPVTLLIVFNLYPAGRLFELSFAEWNGISPSYEYVGLENYVELFEGESIETLANNLAYMIMHVFMLGLSVILAVILDGSLRAKSFIRSVIFMPRILNIAAIAFMFNFIYSYEQGPINELFRALGMEEYVVSFFPNSYAINFSLAFITLWASTGFHMVIFLAGLQSIPDELYEVAAIDGAKYGQKIRHIMLPNLSVIIQLNIFLAINGAVKTFQLPLILTNGGPANRSSTFVFQTIQTAFENREYGLAAAMGVFATIVILTVVAVQRLFTARNQEA